MLSTFGVCVCKYHVGQPCKLKKLLHAFVSMTEFQTHFFMENSKIFSCSADRILRNVVLTADTHQSLPQRASCSNVLIRLPAVLDICRHWKSTSCSTFDIWCVLCCGEKKMKTPTQKIISGTKKKESTIMPVQDTL